MSYTIYTFNLGTGKPQAYVLHGEGDHEGTNLSVSFEQMSDLLRWCEIKSRLEDSDHEPMVRSLLIGGSKTSAATTRRFSEELDRMFELRHAEVQRLRFEANANKTGD